MSVVTLDCLQRCAFLRYADTPDTVWMREIYSGMYISYDFAESERCFRLMPDWRRGFPGIILPHTELSQVFAMVAAMGGDWCEWCIDVSQKETTP